MATVICVPFYYHTEEGNDDKVTDERIGDEGCMGECLNGKERHVKVLEHWFHSVLVPNDGQ